VDHGIVQSDKPEVFKELGGKARGKRISFFDLHQTEVVPVVNAEQYCEYPDSIIESGVDLHAFHENTCGMQILYADAESNGLSLGCYSFPANFTFPLHWHDSDQIILVQSGMMFHGNKELHPGSGYFTRAGATYSFRAGPDGVSFYEFRPVTNFRTVMVEDDPSKYVRDAG
jgi:hypothetical protein